MSYFKNSHSLIEQADLCLRRLRSTNVSLSLTETQIMIKLKKYNLMDALKSIGRIYQIMFQRSLYKSPLKVFYYEYPNEKYVLRADCLLKLAHLFIKSGANDFRTKYLSEKAEANILFLNQIISNHLEQQIPITDDTLLNNLLILYKEQIELQKDDMYSISRSLLLYEKDFESDFKNVTGVGIKDYFYMSFLLIMYLNNNKTYFFLQEILDIAIDGKLPNFSIEKFKKFINYLSIDIKTYKQEINKNKNLIPLEIWPILKTKKQAKDLYCVPVPAYLAKKIFNNIFYDIARNYESMNSFTQKFGLVFENYVGDLLKHYKLEVLSEKDIKYKKNKSDAAFVDWLVIDEDIVYLIEVKSISMGLNDIYKDNIVDFIKKHIFKAYKQIITKLNDIEKKSELSFLRDKEVIPIIIFRDVPFVNLNIFQDIFLNILKNAMINDKSCFTIYNYLQKNNIYVFNIDEFEVYWTNKDIIDIKELFLKLQQSVNQESIISCLEKIDGYKPNMFLNEAYDDFFSFFTVEKD